MFGSTQLIIAAIAAASVLSGAFFTGKSYERRGWEVKVAEANAEINRLTQESKIVTEKIVTEYKDKIKYITKIEKVNVPIYITKEADDKCIVSNGAITVINAAAKNEETPAADNKVNEDSNKKLSELAATVKENYNTYNKVKQQLTSLQDWIKNQQLIWNAND